MPKNGIRYEIKRFATFLLKFLFQIFHKIVLMVLIMVKVVAVVVVEILFFKEFTTFN